MARHQAMDAGQIAAYQPLCDFDLSARILEWVRFLLVSYEQAFNREGVDMRTHDMGISFRLKPDAKGRADLVAIGTGHPRAPMHVEVLDTESAWGWISTLARRHLDCERIIALGHDPASPPPSAILADACLVREAARSGMAPQDLCGLIPIIGETVLGSGWRTTKGHPRVIDAGGLRAHVIRDVGRIRLVRLGLGDMVAYEPPNPDILRSVASVTIKRTQLPETMRSALVGQPLSRLVDVPSLDAGATIRSFGKSGAALLVRLDGCGTALPME